MDHLQGFLHAGLLVLLVDHFLEVGGNSLFEILGQLYHRYGVEDLAVFGDLSTGICQSFALGVINNCRVYWHRRGVELQVDAAPDFLKDSFCESATLNVDYPLEGSLYVDLLFPIDGLNDFEGVVQQHKACKRLLGDALDLVVLLE